MNNSEQRLELLRENLYALEIDGLLVTNLANIRWLSGFTGTSAKLLITHDQAVLSTDSRYWIRAQAEAPEYTLFKDGQMPKDTAALLNMASLRRVGIEANHITLAQADSLNQMSDFTWVPLPGPIEELRQFKDEQEVAAIREAALITDRAMALVPDLVKVGISERELAWQLEMALHENGADALAFPIIVAFGPNSALPHHDPGTSQLGLEEIVLVDMGAELRGYKSDMTRSFYFGQANGQFQYVFDLVSAAQDAALNGIAAGAKSNEAHQLAIDVIDAGGHRDNFGHGLGHGLGLEIHELPWLSISRKPQKLSAGMTITIEPGVYITGWGGIRIEDLVTLTHDGFQLLSHSPKSPYIN